MDNENGEVKAESVSAPVTPTSKDYLVRGCTHLGKILSNISIVGLLLMLSSFFLTYLLIAAYYFLLILGVLITLFLILFSPQYRAAFTDNAFISDFTSFISGAIFIIGPITIFTSVLALILLLIDKTNRSKGRIAYSATVLVLSVLALVFYAIFHF